MRTAGLFCAGMAGWAGLAAADATPAAVGGAATVAPDATAAAVAGMPALPAEAQDWAAAQTPAGIADRAAHDEAARAAGAAAGLPVYRIAAVIHPGVGVVEGWMTVEAAAEPGAPWDRVRLALRPAAALFADASLVVTSARVLARSDGGPTGTIPVQRPPTDDAARELSLAPALPAGARITLAVDWRMTLSKTDGDGGLDTRGAHGCVLWRWYPELCARRDGQWQSAEDTLAAGRLADHACAIGVPAGWDLVGTGDPVGTPAGPLVEHRWLAPRCRHLGLALGHFHRAESVVGAGADAVTVRSWWWTGDDNGGRRALAAAAAAMARHGALLGDFPRRTLDVVEADIGAPGMAAGNLVMLPALAYPAPLRPAKAAKDLPDDLVHAAALMTAHAWWEDVIGCASDRQPWLAEGLSGWCAGDDLAHLADAATAVTVLEDRLAEFREAVQDQDQALDGPPAAYPGDLWAGMADKGTLVLVALRRQMGDAAFREFLGDLARSRAGQGLDGAGFRAALAARLGEKPAAAFYATWIHDGKVGMRDFSALVAAERAAASASAAASSP
jgi:hypothetical protein